MESIKLNLIPSDNTKPVCHASQYDIGRSIRLELYDGDFPYILSDETIELDVKKGDGNVITTDLDFEVGDAYVDMITTEQMTAIAGQNFCELKISKDAAVIYTKNFILKVEQSVLEGGIQSESEINNLETQIAGLVEEAVENQYDSENVIFDSEPTAGHGTGYTVTSSGLKTALDAKADASDLPDMTQYYTKTATDTLLDAKADKATTYTKTETDTALASKANASDVYTKAQVDTIAEAKADASDVYDKNTIDEKMAEKADIDGDYDQLTSGLAKQIKSSVGNEDKTPYLFRTAGGSIDIGDREEDSIIGATVAFNQLIQNGNFESTSGWTAPTGTFSVSNNIGFFTPSAQNQQVTHLCSFVANHKYLISVDITLTTSTNKVYLRCIGENRKPTDSTTSKQRVSAIINSSLTSNTSIGVRDERTSDFDTIKIENCMCIDITQMFGSTIADYIYSLENSTAGAGVAWLKNHGFMTKPYYPYNAGQLISVKTSKHITRGFNAWDEQWELGGMNYNCVNSKNLIKVIPNTTYRFTYKGTNTQVNSVYANYFDADGNIIEEYSSSTGVKICSVNATFTTPSNAHYLKFRMQTYYGTTYNNDICINLHWDGERDGEYEPYVEHEYPLDGTKEWRGRFKLDTNNKLYADGDRYPSDGQAERRYGIVTLDGSESWTWDSYNSLAYTAITNGKIIDATTQYNVATFNSNGAITDSSWANRSNYTLAIGMYYGQSRLFFKGAAITSKEDAKTYFTNNPTTVIFELETITTENAEPYTNPQLVDDFGTEEYEDTRDIPVPVGHETMYQANLRAKLEMAPESPSGNGDYLVRQTNGQNEYVAFTKELPVAPTTDGNYRLKLTVSGGTPSLSWEEIT